VFPGLVHTGGASTVHLAGGQAETIGDVKTLSYATLVVPLVKAVQELKAANDNQAAAIEDLRREIEALKAAR